MAFATAIALAGLGVASYSVVRQGMVESAEAKAKSDVEKYNARTNELTARALEMKAKFDQIRHRKTAAKQSGTLRARLGVSGALLAEGAPLMALAEDAANVEMESLLVGHEGLTKAAQARAAGGMHLVQADLFEDFGRTRQRGSLVQASATLLQGLGTMSHAGMFGGSGAAGAKTTTLANQGTTTFRA